MIQSCLLQTWYGSIQIVSCIQPWEISYVLSTGFFHLQCCFYNAWPCLCIWQRSSRAQEHSVWEVTSLTPWIANNLLHPVNSSKFAFQFQPQILEILKTVAKDPWQKRERARHVIVAEEIQSKATLTYELLHPDKSGHTSQTHNVCSWEDYPYLVLGVPPELWKQYMSPATRFYAT